MKGVKQIQGPCLYESRNDVRVSNLLIALTSFYDKIFSSKGDSMKILFLVAIATLISIPSFASITVSPSHVMFGQVKMHQYNQRMVQVRNNGKESVNIRMSGYCAEYRVSNHCYSLNQYGSCNVMVTFNPSRPGYHTCNMTFRASNGSVSYLNISGTAVR